MTLNDLDNLIILATKNRVPLPPAFILTDEDYAALMVAVRQYMEFPTDWCADHLLYRGLSIHNQASLTADAAWAEDAWARVEDIVKKLQDIQVLLEVEDEDELVDTVTAMRDANKNLALDGALIYREWNRLLTLLPPGSLERMQSTARVALLLGQE